MLDVQIIQYGIYLLVGVAVFLALEALYLTMSNRRSYARKINRRLKVFDDAGSQQDVLLILRRERGLSEGGRFRLPSVWVNRLVMQSGIGVSTTRLVAMVLLPALAGYVACILFLHDAWLALAAAAAAGLVTPLLTLLHMRRKRRQRFEAGLPDAVDVLVRSLRAGHPLPVAIGMVGREMPDPIGTEFGMTADELTYGLDLETAMGNMAARVGQEDLALLVVAISIQAKTGGNLAEILDNLSNVIRARFKMRRRIKAVSAEGRFSALGLSALPVAVFCLLQVITPSYYGDLMHEPAIMNGLGLAVGMIVVGNYIMYRMVNFRI